MYLSVRVCSGECYLPFGGGATYCPGRRFARNEVKTLVVFLLQQFTFTLSAATAGGGSTTGNDGSRSTATAGAPSSSQSHHPGFDGSRAGIGIFPPKKDVEVSIAKRA